MKPVMNGVGRSLDKSPKSPFKSPFVISYQILVKKRIVRLLPYDPFLAYLFILVLTLLIGDATAGLASGLARGLALTAAALLGALTKILGL